jgi:hypothetical protein
MPLVCPECKQLFEQNGVCPLCNVVLLYHAQNLQNEPSPSKSAADDSSEWQQTPWGKIFVGLVLAQGLSYGLQQILTAGFLASGDGSDTWDTLLGIVIHHAILGFSLLIGGVLSGAGQSRGIIYGALVGFTSGIISFFVQDLKGEFYSSVLVYAIPLIHLATGALGGALGMLIWRPTPKLPELEGTTTPTPVIASQVGSSLANLFAGPVYLGRVSAGAFLIVIGVVWSKAILDFLLRASNGTLTISSQLQAQLVSLEITALVALVGAGFAGATTRNGLKQGLCVGIAAAAIVLGLQINGPKFTLESAIFTQSGIITVALVGGWFGGQLFPPVSARRRKGHIPY